MLLYMLTPVDRLAKGPGFSTMRGIRRVSRVSRSRATAAIISLRPIASEADGSGDSVQVSGARLKSL